MSAVRSRLRMLERRARQQPCPLCGDTALARVAVHFEGEPPPVTSACPACGRADVTVLEIGPRRWTRPRAPAHSDTLS